jgi:AcrR family transcriptional regulator
MSRNIAKRKIDQRIRRTRDQLGDALMELALEKPFDAITVQDVIDRAGVSRSTFYVHYNDKDDLFISDVDEFFEGMATVLSRRGDSSDRIAPVRELFAHVADASRFQKAIVASGKLCCRCCRGGSRRRCPHHRRTWTICITAWFGAGSSVRYARLDTLF